MKLYNYQSEEEQVAWAVEQLKRGGRIHDIGLWLGGVDRPMRIVAGTKLALRAEGKTVVKAIEKVRDAGRRSRRPDVAPGRRTSPQLMPVAEFADSAVASSS
jgi:hypothetical protein